MSHLSPTSADRFLNFLHCLGSDVQLNTWMGYSGLMDTSPPFRHGKKAIFTTLHHRPILFPILPWFLDPNSAEELVACCTTVLVYVEHGGHFDAPLILPHSRQNFIHSYIVVSPDADGLIRVCDIFRCSIGRYRPSIPRDLLIELGPSLRTFLLYKMVNADRTAAICKESECLDIIRRRNRQALIDVVVDEATGKHVAQSLTSPKSNLNTTPAISLRSTPRTLTFSPGFSLSQTNSSPQNFKLDG